MMEFAIKNPQHEILGIFFGQILKDLSIQIQEAYPFRVGRRQEVAFEDEDYVKAVPLIKDCTKRNLDWLGWFHSHPFSGDAIHMSSIDINHQQIQQQLNPFWTALILNPHQISDPTTTKGVRAFRLQQKTGKKPSREICRLNLSMIQ